MRSRTAACWAALCLLSVGSSSGKDYGAEWQALGIIQPELRFLPGATPDYRWRRIRAVAYGPFTSTVKAKVQVNYDWDTKVLTLLDGYVDWLAVQGPTNLRLLAGLQYPNWAHEGQVFPSTVNYPYIVASPRLFLREAGVQAHVGFLNDYRVSLGVFNGRQSFHDDNDRPNYFAAFTTVQPSFDARAWYLTGYDETTAGAQAKTELLGVELVNARRGNLGGEAMFAFGQRFGRRMIGSYLELSYRLTGDDTVRAKFDWADLNRDVAGSTSQRYILGYDRRFTSWLTSKWNLEIDQQAGDVRALIQGDLRL